MVIFRENCEDIYAGIEFEAGREENKKFLEAVQGRLPEGIRQDPLPESSGIGIKPVSKEGTERLIRAAIEYAITQQAQERDPRAQGQHHEVHRRRVPQLGLRPGRARIRRQGLHLGPVGAHQGQDKGEKPPRMPSRTRRSGRRQGHHQGRDRRHHPAAGADPPDRVRRDRHAATSTATTSPTRSPRRSAASASRRAATSTTSPATPCSRPPTARRRSTPTSTR
jgi:hypothetical protein